MIEEHSLCHRCAHGRPENWCAEFGTDMKMVKICSAFSETAESSNSSSMAGYDAIRVKKLVDWLERQAEEAAKNADVFEDNRSDHLLEEINFRAAAEIIKAAAS